MVPRWKVDSRDRATSTVRVLSGQHTSSMPSAITDAHSAAHTHTLAVDIDLIFRMRVYVRVFETAMTTHEHDAKFFHANAHKAAKKKRSAKKRNDRKSSGVEASREFL